MKKDSVDILFLGDVAGRPGRKAAAKFIEELKNCSVSYKYFDKSQEFKQIPDFIIVNVENASHGFGLTERNYNEFVNLGIDALTSGNHIWDKKEIFQYVEGADRLVRPLNYPKDTPGEGIRVFEKNGLKIGVVNMLGRVFMNPIDSPWSALEKAVESLKKETNIIIVDFHAEATAEKISYGYFADNLGVSALVGTHTHVQTADESILQGGMGYITDVGYCGAYHSIIGMDIESSVHRLKTGLPERYEVAEMGLCEVDGLRLLIDSVSGRTEKISRFKYITEVREVN